MDDLLRLETPEQIEIDYDIARLGSRVIAVSVDNLAILLLQLMLWFGSLFLFSLLDTLVGHSPFHAWSWAIVIVLSFLLFWGYYLIFEWIWNGQTPGKRLVGIRTVGRDGYPIGFRESAIRNLLRILDYIVIGVLAMFVDRQSRRVGDFAAGTLVVHERPAKEIRSLYTTATEDPRLLDPPILNLDRLTPEEVEAIRRFLQRRSSLANADVLANQLTTRFSERLGLEEPLPLDDIQFLRRVIAQYGR